MAFCYNTLNGLRYILRLAFSIIMCHDTATNNIDSYAINYLFKMQILEKLENWVEGHLVVKMDNNQGIPGED